MEIKVYINQEYESFREEAKQILLTLFKVPEGYSIGLIERLVDCIIGAAVLKVAGLQQETILSMKN